MDDISMICGITLVCIGRLRACGVAKRGNAEHRTIGSEVVGAIRERGIWAVIPPGSESR